MGTNAPSVINRRYELLRRLGEGAQGAVYAVRDRLFPERPTALKLIAGDAPEALLLFEFERLERFEHPHLARVYDLGRAEEVEGDAAVRERALFFTQELVPGADSDAWIAGVPRGQRHLAAARIGVAVARALLALHSRGVLHGDVKPSNIIVGGDAGGPSVKLIDFGLSRSAGAARRCAAGTLAFMAPEAIAGFAEERSDLFGLGATLLRLSDPAGNGAEPFAPQLLDISRRLTAPRAADRTGSAREALLALGRAFGAEILGEGRGGELLDAASAAEDPSAEASRGRSTDLLGRDAELAKLLAAIRGSLSPAARRPGLVFVSGPAGIGKTRLVRTALVALQIEAASGAVAAPLVLSGSASDVISAVREGSRVPVPAAPGDDAVREAVRAFDRLRQPALCAIDDGDSAPGAALLRRLAASDRSADGSPAPLCVVAAMRDAGLARIEAESAGGALIELSPLSEEAEAQLVAASLGTAPGPRLIRALRERTGGIPLLTESLAGALAARGTPSDEERLLRSLPAPAGMSRLLSDGLTAAVSREGRRALAALAALGGPATIGEVVETAELGDRAPVLEAASALERRGLVPRAPGDDRLRMSPFAADALLDALGEDERRAIFGRAFAALSKRPVAGAAALSRAAVGASLEAEIGLWSRRAAEEEKARGALAEAARHLEASLAHVERTGAAGGEEVILELAGLHRQTGEYARAAQLLDRLVDDGGGVIRSRARVAMAAVRRLTGRTADALALLEGTEGPDPETSLEALALEARIRLESGDVPGAERCLARAGGGDEAAQVRSGAAAAEGLLAWHKGDIDGARRKWTAGRDAARRMGEVAHESKLHGLLGMAAHAEHAFAEAARCWETALELADRAGDAHGAATHAVNLAAAATELGDLSEALVRYRDGMARLSRIGRRDEVITARANHAQLLLRLGDVAGADRASRRLEEDLAVGGLAPAAAGIALCVRADVLLALDDPGAAAERLTAAIRSLAGDTGSTARACRRHLVAALLARGELDRAEEALAALDAPTAEERLAVQQLSLSLALARGRGAASALDALLPSLSDASAIPTDAGALRTLVTAAKAARETGRRELARDLADRGELLVERLRRATPPLHRPDAYRGLAELRALGRAEPSSRSLDEGPIWARLAKINTRLNSETRVGALLDLVMDNALDVAGGERGFLLVRDPGGGLRIRSARNIDRDSLLGADQCYSRGVAERAFETGEPIATTDAGADSRFNEYRSVLALNLLYIIAVPLQVEGRVEGVIYVDSRSSGRFDEGRLAVLRAFADQAAIALTNARLRAENRRRQVRIEKLNRALASKLERREDELARVRRDLERRTAAFEEHRARYGMIGGSAAMLEVFRVLDRVAGAEVPVVIAGESGTGKELAARAIHFTGPRKLRPFVAENCAAIPEALLESILFGHVRGAFTGAARDAHGLFVEADKGTLFLDEIGELPLELQAKLLRVLQDGEVRPVGGNRTVRVDVRIIAATNRPLEKLVQEKRFRDDLYYRLHVMELRMPPLRERPEDVPELVDHFVAKHAKERAVRVDAAALEALAAYHWPGNVRQLENEIVRALVLSEDRLGVEHLSEAVTLASSRGDLDLADLDMERHLDLLQRRLVRAALERAGGNRTKAASLLGISRFGLQKMMARMGL